MTAPVSDLATLLATMEPTLNPLVYVYASVPLDTDLGGLPLIASFREAEGLTVIAAEADAARAGLTVLFRAAWITLTVHSDLQAVGLTAAFARALGDAGISCNVMAAAFHDHLFVPVDSAQPALDALRRLQQQSALR